MTTTCPACEAEVTLVETSDQFLNGICPSCGGVLLLVKGRGAPGAPGTSAPAGEPASEEGDAGSAEGKEAGVPGLTCADCGGRLTVRSTSESTLATVCAGCGTENEFRQVDEDEEEEEDERPRSRTRPGPRDSRSEFARPPGRPCRECGGRIQFSTTEDGLVQGACESCGNRFTLPPRRDGPGAGPGRKRFPSRGGGFRPRSGGTREWRRDRDDVRPREGGRPRYGRRPADDSSDFADRRRRRRPRPS